MKKEIQIQVRYHECDPMGVVHHATYPVWFEMGRTELLRDNGDCYRQLEESGLFLVVSELQIRYKASARYDDVLLLKTTLEEVTRVRVTHSYALLRGKQLIASATTVLACVDGKGNVQPIPEHVAKIKV
jgi:acyl-CoA thioester hydrolase